MKSGMILGDSGRRAVGGPLAHGSGKSRPRDKEKQHYNNQQVNTALRCEGRKNSNLVRAAGHTVDLSLYPRLASLICGTAGLDPQLKTLSWVIRITDELYNARRRADQASFKAEEDYCNLDAGTRRHASFPAFVYKHLKNRHGIKHMVRLACLDLLFNTHIYRKHHSEVEVFARFLEEFYGQKELYFYLSSEEFSSTNPNYEILFFTVHVLGDEHLPHPPDLRRDVRAEAHRVTRVCTGRRSMIQPVWMSHADCARVAKGVFLDTTTLYFRDLVATVQRRMLEHRPESDQSKSDRRRISLSDFLYVAMVCFVSPKKPQEEHAHDSFPAGGDHPPCEGGSISVWSEGEELAACEEVSPVPVLLKSSSLEDRHISGPEVSSDGSSSSSSSSSRSLGTAGRNGRDDYKEGSSTCPRFSRQHICGANREPSDDATRGATYDSSKTAPIEIMADFHRPIKSSDNGKSFLDDGGAHTYLTGEKCRSPMVLLGNAKAGRSTSPVQTPKEIISPREHIQRGSILPNAVCTVPRTVWSPPPEPSRDSHEANTFAKRCQDSPQAKQPLRLVDPPSPKSPPTRHQQRLFRGKRGQETPPIDRVPTGISVKAQEEIHSPNATRKSGLIDGASLHVWGAGMSKKETLGEIRKARMGTEMGRMRAPVTSPLVASRVAADTPSFPDRVATVKTGNRTCFWGETIAEGGKNSNDGRESCCWSRAPTFGENHTSYDSNRWSGDGNHTACVTVEDPSGAKGFRTPSEISDDFVSAHVGEQKHESEDETQVDEEEKFFSLPCSPCDRPRPNRDPLAATREATHVAGATRMPFSGITMPSKLDDVFSLSKPLGTRKLGGFHKPVKHTRRENIDSTGKRSDEGASDDQSKGASPPPLRGGYLRRACSGKDKRIQRETLGDVQLEDEPGDELEIRTDVLEIATDIFAVFERKFLPCLAGTASSGPPGPMATEREKRGHRGKANDFLPPGIRRVLSEEMVRGLSLHRRDLHAVARQSPELLDKAVEEAFCMLESAVSTAATHSRALCNMGRLLEERGNPDEALLCFEEASAVDAASAEALCWRAGNLQRRGDLAGATIHFEGALSRDGSFSSAWYGLGQVKAALGKNADAVKAFTRWFDESNKHWIGSREERGTFQANGLIQLGDVHRSLGQDEYARRSYEKAIEMDDGCPEAHFKLGSLLLQTQGGHDAEVLEEFRRAVNAAAASPDNSEKRKASPERHQREYRAFSIFP